MAKARNLASWVLSVFKTRNIDVIPTLYNSLVLGIFEFNSPEWNPTKIGEIQAIAGVQKTFTSRIYLALQALHYSASLENPERHTS